MTGLSEKSRRVLGLIAKGCSYGQIVDGNSDVTYRDIFFAAEEALRLGESNSNYKAWIQEKNPRAYEPWTEEEDRTLVSMYEKGVGIQEIATQLQRQSGAIRSRIRKLGLS